MPRHKGTTTVRFKVLKVPLRVLQRPLKGAAKPVLSGGEFGGLGLLRQEHHHVLGFRCEGIS